MLGVRGGFTLREKNLLAERLLALQNASAKLLQCDAVYKFENCYIEYRRV